MSRFFHHIAFVALVALAGCGKKDQPPAKPAAAPAPIPSLAAPAAAPVAPPNSPVAAQPAAQPEEVKPALSMSDIPPGFTDADALNMVIENFTSEHGRLPRDLNELVTTKAVKRLPKPPSGKKFVLENGRVKIVPN